jgi:hypothetical protein
MEPRYKLSNGWPLGLVGACLIFAAAWICLAVQVARSSDEGVPTELRVEIGKLVDGVGLDADLEPVEGRLLTLTAKWKAPEERAAIYAAISSLYGNRRIRGPEAWKVVGYAQKALEHTTDLQERCSLYIDWASARGTQIASGLIPKDGFPEARRNAAVPYLHILAIVAQNLKITERQPPFKASADISESQPSDNSPRLHEWAVWANKRIQEQSKEWDLQEHLFVLKPQLIGSLARLYSTPPYATEELRRLATEIVKKPEMVKEIMEAVEAKIREQEAKAQEKGEKAAAGAVPPKTEQAPPQP